MGFIACGVATLNLSPSGSIGMVTGRSQRLFVENTSGGAVTVTLNPNWTKAGNIPATLSPGQSVQFLFDIFGTNETDVVVGIVISSATSGGTVTNVSTAGRGIGGGPITGSGTITAFDPDHFNVCDYGADPTGTADSYAAIAAAIAAGVATNLPFSLYGPKGIYKISHKLTINIATTGQAVSILGDGQGVTQWLFTDAAADSGFVINKATGGGSSSTDAPCRVANCSIVCSAANQGTAILLNQTGAGSAGTQMTVIENVGFFGDTNGTHYWNIGLDTFSWVYIVLRNCWLGCDTGWRIRGNTGATSVFWAIDNNFQGGTYGVKADGSAGGVNRIEGVFCRGNSFIQQKYAVWMDNGGSTGGALEVSGGQINGNNATGSAGVHAAWVAGIVVKGISSFGPGAVTGAWNGVEILDGCWSATVEGNCFFTGGPLSPVSGVCKGVYIKGGPSSAPQGQTNVVVGNNFQGVGTAGAGSKNVHFDSLVTRSLCTNNAADGGAYTDTPGTNTFNNNI